MVLVSKSKKNKIKKKFIETFINNWLVKHETYLADIRKIEWYPYNISERLANYAILSKNKVVDKNPLILKILTYHLYFLTLNIEIYKDKLSNHSLNNARAIFLFSSIINDVYLQNFSRKLILYLCKKFIDKNGFFKFGSSHYQFIFTKWLIEIYQFMLKFDKKNIDTIERYLKKSMSACNFFLVREGKKYSIPFFGNISPDYTPNFMIDYVKSFIEKKKINSTNSKEWIKIQNKSQIIFFRNPMINKFNFNHAHSDYFHFVNYYKGNPVMIDIGRKNYLPKNKKYILALSHNSILINGKGIFDDYVNKNIFNKLEMNQLEKEKYSIKKKKNKIECISKIKNEYFVKRIFEIKPNELIIEDFINSKRVIDKIEIPFFIDANIKIKKIDYKNYLLESKKIKATLSVNTKEKDIGIKVLSTNKLGLAQCESYGQDKKNKFLKIECFSKKSFSSSIQLRYIK